MAKSTTNAMVVGRWELNRYQDQEKIQSTLNRIKDISFSDLSVTADAPLMSRGNHLMHDLYSRIEKSRVVFVPARPSSTRDGCVTRKELDYARQKNKLVIAVDTGSTKSNATYFERNKIPVVPCRKDSLKKVLNSNPKARG
jgi:hypothetical protein